MTTPTKTQIEDKAKELYFKAERDRYITPTEAELAESGYTYEARNQLMRDQEKHEVLGYLESMANEYGLELVKQKPSELAEQSKPYDFTIDLNEALRSGVFIAGGKGTTKSNLGKIIAQKLMEKNVTVKVFDISRAWLKSSIPYVYKITTNIRSDVNLYRSVIFDLSVLLPKDTKRFISLILAKEWDMQVRLTELQRKWIVYVFEEVQDLIPQGRLRSNEAQQVLRLFTTGRNYKMSYVAITQRPALTDTSVFELTFQKYFARMNGENDLRKVANYIGAKAYDLEKLRIGEFFYDKGSETKWITTEEFKAKTKPQALTAYRVRKR